MADWATISSIGTATGTLVLAVATYASVRSSRRSAQASERALLAAIRPVLVNARHEDPFEKIGFVDQHWLKVPGGDHGFWQGAIRDRSDPLFAAVSRHWNLDRNDPR